MRLPWQPREYERICADCGCTWRVPHQFARRRVQSVSMFARPMYRGGLDPKSLEHSELDAEVAASMEISKQAQAFKACPKCGSERYTQRRAHLYIRTSSGRRARAGRVRAGQQRVAAAVPLRPLRG